MSDTNDFADHQTSYDDVPSRAKGEPLPTENWWTGYNTLNDALIHQLKNGDPHAVTTMIEWGLVPWVGLPRLMKDVSHGNMPTYIEPCSMIEWSAMARRADGLQAWLNRWEDVWKESPPNGALLYHAWNTTRGMGLAMALKHESTACVDVLLETWASWPEERGQALIDGIVHAVRKGRTNLPFLNPLVDHWKEVRPAWNDAWPELVLETWLNLHLSAPSEEKWVGHWLRKKPWDDVRFINRTGEGDRFHAMVEGANVGAVNAVLKHGVVTPDLKWEGVTPLMRATWCWCTTRHHAERWSPMIEVLLDGGADPVRTYHTLPSVNDTGMVPGETVENRLRNHAQSQEKTNAPSGIENRGTEPFELVQKALDRSSLHRSAATNGRNDPNGFV